MMLTMFLTFTYFHHFRGMLLLSTIVNVMSVHSAFWGSRQVYSNGLLMGEKGYS